MSNKTNKNFFMKHKILTGVLVIAVLIGAIGALGSNGSEPKKVGESTTDKTTSASTEDKNNKVKTFKVGDVVQLKNLKVTVNKVYDIKGDEFNKPQDGNKFLGVDCTIENISKEDQAISSMIMFKVVDKDGRACEYSLTGMTATKSGQLDGTIGSGRKMSGVYAVEVPNDKTGLELEFDNSLLGSGDKVIVTLN